MLYEILSAPAAISFLPLSTLRIYFHEMSSSRHGLLYLHLLKDPYINTFGCCLHPSGLYYFGYNHTSRLLMNFPLFLHIHIPPFISSTFSLKLFCLAIFVSFFQIFCCSKRFLELYIWILSGLFMGNNNKFISFVSSHC